MPHTPLYIVASPQPRVGKTLIARLLIEYVLSTDRPLAGYDLDPKEPSLIGFFPKLVRTADITDTLGQMALFDQLVANDSCTTVIDLGYSLFDQFFAVMAEIGFEIEARRRSIDPIVLFVTDSSRATARTYDELKRSLRDTNFVPVHNESASFIFAQKDFLPSRTEYSVIRIPRLSPVVRGVIHRPNFTFRAHMEDQPGGPSEVQSWITAIFTEFRELELRQLMGRVTGSIGTRAALRTREAG
ncbi:MAG TPA: hypothetical protein VMJ52_08270 [Xanthobacteraceae bacterium]|nr:hypothetical protein [Xanthobacteraceae bacterium]